MIPDEDADTGYLLDDLREALAEMTSIAKDGLSDAYLDATPGRRVEYNGLLIRITRLLA